MTKGVMLFGPTQSPFEVTQPAVPHNVRDALPCPGAIRLPGITSEGHCSMKWRYLNRPLLFAGLAIRASYLEASVAATVQTPSTRALRQLPRLRRHRRHHR